MPQNVQNFVVLNILWRHFCGLEECRPWKIVVDLLNDISKLNILIRQYFLAHDISLHGLHGFVSDEKLYFKEGNKKRLRRQI